MAGVFLNAASGECALAAATAKTVLQIKAAANQRVLLNSLRIMGKQPAGGTDTPVKVRLTRSTGSFGTGTALTAGTDAFAKNDPNDGETVQTAVHSNFTVEPTSPADAGIWYEVSPQTGIIEFLPPGQEIKIPGGAALNVECTAPASATITVTAGFQE